MIVIYLKNKQNKHYEQIYHVWEGYLQKIPVKRFFPSRKAREI